MSDARAAGDRIAVIDIGTNTLLLLIADVRGRDLVAVHEACEFGRLGKGLDATGVLDAEAVTRSLDMVTRYRATMDQLGVTRVRVVGTQALREARNASAFVEPAEGLLGAPIEIVAGEREAALAYRAAHHSLPQLQGKPFVIADVGGGSTEVIVSTDDGAGVASFTSLPIGSVRLHERHLHGDPPTAAEIQALYADIDRALATIDLPSGTILVGSAGTATTMATLALAMDDYDPDIIQGHTLTAADIQAQIAMLFAMTVAERRDLPGLLPQRADVIAAGAAIFARLMRRLGTDTFMVNDRGIRWGLAYEMLD